jgi:GDP-L-fucose synthase
MEIHAPILVTGSTGMVGSAVVRLLRQEGFDNIHAPSRNDLDLSDQASVSDYFSRTKPRHVLMIAAKVGGIGANIADPVGFIDQNLRITLNLYAACKQFLTEKNLFLGSSCMYPRQSPQPMREDHLMQGPVEPTNEAYALAKLAGVKLAQYYWHQHKMLTVCPIPSNIYGTGDHFDLKNSHVLSALVRRFVDAVDEGTRSVAVWGTGSARREFTHVDDVARGVLFFMRSVHAPDHLNLGPGTDVSIRELAETIAAKTGFGGEIAWDVSKPDGMPRKVMDIEKLNELGFCTSVGIEEGIERTIAEYRALKLASNGQVPR